MFYQINHVVKDFLFDTDGKVHVIKIEKNFIYYYYYS